MNKKLFVCIVMLLALLVAVCSVAIAEGECAHSWTAGKPATCGKGGTKLCSVCGKEEATAATGDHNWTAGKPATCGKDGTKMCSVCGKEEAVAATGDHNWTAGKPATCGKDGTKMCSVCGKEEAVAATGAHTYITVEATCKSEGNTTCSVCGNVKETTPVTNNHAWTAGKPATCGKDGTKMCSVCGKEEAVAATGAHTWIAGKPATCNQPGSQICSVCGKEEAVAATGAHTWIAGKPATCNQPGTQICSACGKEEATEATGAHTWADGKPATCEKGGTQICTVCGKEEATAAAKHTYKATKKVSATTTRRGYTVYTCEVCGDSYKGNYKAKKVAATPVPTATPAPAAVDAELFGSIVTDAEFEPELYEAVIDTKAVEGVEAENNMLVITASADETGAYVLRNLHLSLELIAELKADGIEYICFVVGEYELVFPLSTFDSEDLALIADAVEEEVTGYVITLDPTAVTTEGVAGCVVTTALATIDGEDMEITGILADLVLTKTGVETEVVVVDNTIHTFAA